MKNRMILYYLLLCVYSTIAMDTVDTIAKIDHQQSRSLSISRSNNSENNKIKAIRMKISKYKVKKTKEKLQNKRK